MAPRSRFIEELKRIAGASNVLLDAEDLYVYSLQGPLGMRQGPKPDVIVRPHSEEEAIKIVKLAHGEGVYVIRRGDVSEETMPSVVLKRPVMMLDLRAHPDVSSLKNGLQKLRKPEIDFFRNWISCLEFRVLSDQLIYRCKECMGFRGTACSGFCTVAPFFDGVETWSSKGRLLLTRGLFAGDLKPTKKLVDSIFTCSTCGQCYDQCTLGGLELNRAIMAARHEIAKKGLVPKPFENMPRDILERGNPMGMLMEERTLWLDELTEKPQQKKAEALYWVGCTTAYRFPNIATSTVNLLRRANVDYRMLDGEEGCCGLILILAGMWNEAREIAVKNVEKLKMTGVKMLFTGCAGCYYAFKKLYPELLKIKVPLDVLHLSQFMDHLVESGDLTFKDLETKVAYQDPCDLGRHCGVYTPPRNIIKAIPGVQLVETYLNRDHATCCGGGGGLWAFNTDLAMNVAHSKLIEEVLPLKVEAIVTACPACYMNLKYTTIDKGIDIKVYDLAEIVEKACL